MKQLLNQIKTKISKKVEVKIEPGETELDYVPLDEYSIKGYKKETNTNSVRAKTLSPKKK